MSYQQNHFNTDKDGQPNINQERLYIQYQMLIQGSYVQNTQRIDQINQVKQEQFNIGNPYSLTSNQCQKSIQNMHASMQKQYQHPQIFTQNQMHKFRTIK